jgi:hypothetical protein
MRKIWVVLIMTVAGLTLMVGSAPGQWTAQGSYGSGDASSLMETPTGSFGDQPSVYYPYWQNYLDNLQREGGYYSVTGNYPGSAPVTSYYPSSPSGDATSPQSTSASGMYYNPSDYYATQGGQPQAGQQYAPPQAYQAPAGQTYYQAPTASTPQATGPPQATTGKKRRISAKGQAAQAAAQQQAYYQQQQQAYAQQLQAYQQQQQAYQQQQQGYNGQQPGYQQQAGYPQQAYGQMQPRRRNCSKPNRCFKLLSRKLSSKNSDNRSCARNTTRRL